MGLLDESNKFVFKCRHKGKFRLSLLGAIKAPSLDKHKNIDFGWFLLEIIIFISVVTSIISQGYLYRGDDSWNFKY